MKTELKAVRRASRELRSASTKRKNQVLQNAARLLKARSAEILAANREDLAALPSGTSAAFRDRLSLDEKRIHGMIESLRQVQKLADPIGEVVEKRTLKNGLRVRRVRAPLGVILMIFESRPNVAVEAFSLALKAGNALILRGGKESVRSCARIYELLHESLEKAGLPRECLWGITDPDRALTEALLKQKRTIDVVVPRGGEGLIDFVSRTSEIPVIKNDRGLCHVYVHSDADLKMAGRIVVNAKTQRPGVCNAMETLLVHSRIAPKFLAQLRSQLPGVEIRADERARTILAEARPATEQDWDTEHLDLILNCRVVDSLEDAIEHIERHGSRHSESIVTKSAKAAKQFQESVDAAAVYWNASTRFTDGFELGLGAELGISTQKLHARGPVGLKELTSVRWIMDGKGQVRG